MSVMKDTLKPLWKFSMIAEEDEEKQVDVDVMMMILFPLIYDL
jgi:hypothetical protein